MSFLRGLLQNIKHLCKFCRSQNVHNSCFIFHDIFIINPKTTTTTTTSRKITMEAHTPCLTEYSVAGRFWPIIMTTEWVNRIIIRTPRVLTQLTTRYDAATSSERNDFCQRTETTSGPKPSFPLTSTCQTTLLVCLTACRSVCRSVCASVCLPLLFQPAYLPAYVCLPLCLSDRLSVYISFCLSASLPVLFSLSAGIFVCLPAWLLSLCLSACRSASLFLCLFFCPRVCFSDVCPTVGMLKANCKPSSYFIKPCANNILPLQNETRRLIFRAVLVGRQP